MPPSPPSMTVPKFRSARAAGQKLAVLTAYDFVSAKLAHEAGADAILVGDSLSMVVQGHRNTLQVTLDQMIYHGEIVARSVPEALVVVDLPFGSYHGAPAQAVENAIRVIRETKASAVKLEGGKKRADLIRAMVDADIPVMAHCGMLPQNVLAMGGYTYQKDRERLLHDVESVEQAGAFAVVLECVSAEIAQEITNHSSIPTIGIGSGSGCDGQVLVFHDVVGLTLGFQPKFARRFAQGRECLLAGLQQYCEEVQKGAFPPDRPGSKERGLAP